MGSMALSGDHPFVDEQEAELARIRGAGDLLRLAAQPQATPARERRVHEHHAGRAVASQREGGGLAPVVALDGERLRRRVTGRQVDLEGQLAHPVDDEPRVGRHPAVAEPAVDPLHVRQPPLVERQHELLDRLAVGSRERHAHRVGRTVLAGHAPQRRDAALVRLLDELVLVGALQRQRGQRDVHVGGLGNAEPGAEMLDEPAVALQQEDEFHEDPDP